jgi:hypothetical protein
LRLRVPRSRFRPRRRSALHRRALAGRRLGAGDDPAKGAWGYRSTRIDGLGEGAFEAGHRPVGLAAEVVVHLVAELISDERVDGHRCEQDRDRDRRSGQQREAAAEAHFSRSE